CQGVGLAQPHERHQGHVRGPVVQAEVARGYRPWSRQAHGGCSAYLLRRQRV
ncbi:hypothetical protein BGZ59_005410, partial [Podila verticillata]